MASLFTPHLLLFSTTSPSTTVLGPLLSPLSCHTRDLLDVMPQRDRSPDGRSSRPPRTEEGAHGTPGRTLQRDVTREGNPPTQEGRGRGARHWRRGERLVLKERRYRRLQEKGQRELVNVGALVGADERNAEAVCSTRGKMRVQGPRKAWNSARNDGRRRGNFSNKEKRANCGGEEGGKLRVELDMCSKRGDVMGAIALYDSAVKEGIRMGQHHFNVLLYLCSSAAIGVVQPAKSGNTGSGIASIDPGCKANSSNESLLNVEEDCLAEGHVQDHERKYPNLTPSDNQREQSSSIPVSDELREYARTRGFEIFKKMCSEKERVPMSEAAMTAVARMAMSMGNGDMAFEIVKQMKNQGITPKLRSYGPALTAFCNSGNVEKAFEVEAHMLESWVIPEEPELETLLKASVAARRGDKVYYLLHKFRTNVRQVSASTAELLEAWFRSSTASKVGKRKWDAGAVAKAIENNGEGWHGFGWLGSGKWTISRTHIDKDGICVACGDKLATIDLDPKETEHFAISVAKLANKRERNSSFQTFQKWLDDHGPFEAVVDAANVGLFSHRYLTLSKVNDVANAIRQMFPSRKWPLIVAHNKHLTGERMKKSANRKLVEQWKQADAIYPTPTGSNDDWYWLYAAIRCKCLLISNDEMRDHTFQLLEKDFFPKWKERHQVHFAYEDSCVTFQMPPPCSVVIQESEKGNWHIPISEEGLPEGERTWLCVTRRNSQAKYNGAPH